MRTLYTAAALLCSCLGLATPAWADYCYPGGQGIYDYDQSTNSYSRFRSCQYPGGYQLPAGVPPPSYNTGPSAAERHQQYVAKEREDMQQDSWGAVAYNGKKYTSDKRVGSKTRAEVEKKVLADCAEDSSAADCQLVVVYKNACVAVVATNFIEEPIIARVADSKQAALDWAMRDCKDSGSLRCSQWGGLACSLYGYGSKISISDTPNDHLREKPEPENADIPIPEGEAWYLYQPTHPAVIDGIRKQRAAQQTNSE